MKPLPFGGDDMFVIVVYDVNQKRCEPVRKYLAQWLEHRQRSVFTGFLTRSQVKKMRQGLQDITYYKEDSLIIYSTEASTKVREWANEYARNAHVQSMITGPVFDEKSSSSKERTGKDKKKKYRFRR